MTWRRILKWSIISLSLMVVMLAAFIGFQLATFTNDQGVSGPFLAARHASAGRDMENASHYYALALARAPEDMRIRNEAFSAFLMNGDMDRAARLAKTLLSDRDMRVEAIIVLLVNAIRAGQYEQASHLLDQFPDGPATRLLTPVISAWLDYAEDRQIDIGRLDPLLDAGPFLSVTSQQAAILFELTGQIIEAENAYEKGVAAGGAMHEIFALSYGAFLERRGETERADRLYKFADEIFGPVPSLENVTNRRASGQAPPKLSTDISFHIAQSFLAFVDALRKDGHAGFARSYVQLAIFLDPSNRARLLLADLVSDQEYWMEAARLYGEVRGTGPYRREALIRQAQMYEFGGDVELSIAKLSAVLQDYPENVSVLTALGDAQRRAEQYAEAEANYARAFQLLGNGEDAPWGLWFSIGICRERLGKWAMAEQDLQMARNLSNDDPVVINYLGYSWIDMGIHLDEAENLVALAVRKAPSNGFYVDSLGWLYFKRGDFDKALLFLEKASQLEPTDAVITDHLGDTLWRLGRKTEARYQWRKALAFEPTEDLAKTLNKKLLSGLLPFHAEERAI